MNKSASSGRQGLSTRLEKSGSVRNEQFVCFFRDGEDLDSQGDGSSQPDTISIASRTSQNTLDSDKVSCNQHFLWRGGGVVIASLGSDKKQPVSIYK